MQNGTRLSQRKRARPYRWVNVNNWNKIYKHNKKVFQKLKKELPNYFHSFPVKKKEIIEAILSDRKNLKKIIKIVHYEVRKKMNYFLKKYNDKKFVVLDVPLLIENKLNKKKYILIFVEAKKTIINSRLKKRKNYNKKIIENFRKLQKTLSYKKKLSTYKVKNDFKLLTIKKRVKFIKKSILDERNSS